MTQEHNPFYCTEFTTASNGSSSSSFDSDAMLNDMRKLLYRMRSTPNKFVTTTRTLDQLRQAAKDRQPKHYANDEPHSLPMTAFGVPIEDYATVKECLDRMASPRTGERLKLVLSEDIPSDCIDHPWIKEQVHEMAERLGYR